MLPRRWGAWGIYMLLCALRVEAQALEDPNVLTQRLQGTCEADLAALSNRRCAGGVCDDDATIHSTLLPSSAAGLSTLRIRTCHPPRGKTPIN